MVINLPHICCVFAVLFMTFAGIRFAHAQGEGHVIAVQEALAATWSDTANGHAVVTLTGFGVPAPTPIDWQAANALSTVTLLFDSVPPLVSDASVIGVYSQILDEAEVAPYFITEDAQQQLHAAYTVLRDQGRWWHRLLGLKPPSRPSKTWHQYQLYASRYGSVLERVEAGTASSAEAESALQEWLVLGFKEHVESAIARHEDATSRDPAVWWGRVRDQFDKFVLGLNASPRSMVHTSVDPESWSSAEGWTRVEVKGATEAVFGVLDVKRIYFVRPWLDARVFSSRSWRWRDNVVAGIPPVSYGQVPQDAATLLPVLPVSIVLAKNIEIRNGPLRLTASDPQVIAWVGERVPTSPNPDEALWRVRPMAPEVKNWRRSIGIHQAFVLNNPSSHPSSPHVGGVYIAVERMSWRGLGAFVGLSPGTRLRGPGPSVGFTLPFPSRFVRPLAGVRFPTGDDGTRVFLGVGFDLPAIFAGSERW